MCRMVLDKEREMYGCKLCIANDKIEEDPDKHKMLDHIEMHHVKSAYECGECGIILPTRVLINTHKLKMHRDAILNVSKNIAEIRQLRQSGTAKLQMLYIFSNWHHYIVDIQLYNFSTNLRI